MGGSEEEDAPLSDLAEEVREADDDTAAAEGSGIDGAGDADAVSDAKDADDPGDAGDAIDADDAGGVDDTADAGREYSLFDRPEIDADAGGDHGAEDGDAEPAGADERAPLSEIADRIDRRRSERREVDDAEAEMFEEMDVGEVDGEEVWATLLSGAAAEEADTEAGGSAVGAGAQAERVGSREDAPEFVVPKEKFCERCPYLADPPELACEHEGTSIVAVVDSEHFRVRNCPFADEEMPDFGGQFEDVD